MRCAMCNVQLQFVRKIEAAGSIFVKNIALAKIMLDLVYAMTGKFAFRAAVTGFLSAPSIYSVPLFRAKYHSSSRSPCPHILLHSPSLPYSRASISKAVEMTFRQR